MFAFPGGLRINAPVSFKESPKSVVPELAEAAELEPEPEVKGLPEKGPDKKPPEPEEKGDLYLARLVKLVPTEIVALYLTFKEVAESFIGVWAGICLLLVIFVRTIGVRQAGKSIQVMAVLIAAVSFILWVYAIGGNMIGISLPPESTGVVSVSVGVWTFIVPYIYKGD